MVSEVAKVGLRASSSQVTLVWWPGRWHIFELWGNCAFFVSPKRAGFGWSLDNEAVPSPRQGKRARRVCACFTRSSLCWAGGVCRWLGLWVNVVLCTLVCATARVLAQECRGRACVPARCARCARGRRYGGPADRSPLCAHLSFAGVSAPGHAVMVWEKRLAQPVPDCLVFCWPFNTLGSASVESHRKVAAALVSPGPSWYTGERSGGISEERT